MSCWSTDRERLFAIYLDRSGWTSGNKEILHFAPEASIVKLLKPGAKRYLTADLFSKKADVNWNIEAIPAEDASFDAVICSHVLEHVDTEKALGEINRVLRPGGKAFLMIPIDEALETTYTDPSITTEEGRYLHFQQPDHTRIIGRDFKDQVRAAGFLLEEFSANASDAVKHSLRMGEKVFVATRPEAA
jgi:ubiquinone/menaquinone biosynthesis C-methylase UbiE